MVDYGQLVIGPPGSGKTTYCQGIHQLLNAIKRPHLVINLDFGNDLTSSNHTISYHHEDDDDDDDIHPSFDPPDIDVRDLITLADVMKDHRLGPNGGLLYCLNHLAQNVHWLIQKITQVKKSKGYDHAYLLFDMPGQVELYTVSDAIHTIINRINDRDRGVRLVAMHLVDSTLCTQPHHYISALMISLSAQIGLELPFLNIFSKADLVKKLDLQFMFEYFARCEDLQYLIPVTHQRISQTDKPTQKEKMFAQFHSAICELVTDYSLVSFLPLDIQDKESTMSVLAMADQANGYALSAYVPRQLRLPGSETAGDEMRLPVDMSATIFGSHLFEKFESDT